MCAVAVNFPFELLDIFLGAWGTIFLAVPEAALVATDLDRVPDGTGYLHALLQHFPQHFGNDVQTLLSAVVYDLRLRGLGDNRISAFKARIQAAGLLLQAVAEGRQRAMDWSARQIYRPPRRIWSPEQQEFWMPLRQAWPWRMLPTSLHPKGFCM